MGALRGFLQLCWLEQLYHVAKVLDAFGCHRMADRVWKAVYAAGKDFRP